MSAKEELKAKGLGVENTSEEDCEWLADVFHKESMRAWDRACERSEVCSLNIGKS